VFRWEADRDVGEVRVLVQYWANLDSLTADHLHQLGIEWSPAEARPFFSALVEGVLDAFAREGVDDPFAQLLEEHAERPLTPL
jgi:hypothetical protein